MTLSEETTIVSVLSHRDNWCPRNIRIDGHTRDHFVAAVAMCMADHTSFDIFKISEHTIELIWYDPSKEGFKLPFTHNAAAVIALTWNWLLSLKGLPDQPDHDGSNSKGWRVESSYEGLKVSFLWIEYHK